MGRYLGVKAVEKHGQRIHAGEEQPPVAYGYVLVMVLDAGAFKIAADVTHESEYAQAYSAYARGQFVRFSVYSLPTERVADCPDEGRVYRTEMQ